MDNDDNSDDADPDDLTGKYDSKGKKKGVGDVVGTGTTKRLRLSTAYTNQRATMVNVVTIMTIGRTWRRRNGRTRTTM